jgi:hypothetical protein
MMLGCDELQPASVVLPLAVARATIDPLAHTLSRVDGLVATAVLAAPPSSRRECRSASHIPRRFPRRSPSDSLRPTGSGTAGAVRKKS